MPLRLAITDILDSTNLSAAFQEANVISMRVQSRFRRGWVEAIPEGYVASMTAAIATVTDQRPRRRLTIRTGGAVSAFGWK